MSEDHIWFQDWLFSITSFAIDHNMSRKPEIKFRNCFSDWYFFFNNLFITKVFELFFAQIRNIFDRFDYLFIENNCFAVGSCKIVSIKGINYKIF